MGTDIIRFSFVETPFKGKNWEETELNHLYTLACSRDCVLRGENIVVSHLLYPQRGILDDRIEAERWRGINAGQEEIRALTKLSKAFPGLYYVCSAVYTDRGISGGMKHGIETAKQDERDVVYRELGNTWEEKFREFLASKDWLDLGKF
jgi:hypothetical protein